MWGWVSPATPSMPLGSSTPCQWMEVCSGSRLVTKMRTLSPSTHSMVGPGDWPFGITAFAGREDNDLVLWLPTVSTIVAGDSLADFGEGLDIQLGGRTHVTRDDVRRRLRPLLDLPIELVLLAHGEPTDRDALERVLA